MDLPALTSASAAPRKSVGDHAVEVCEEPLSRIRWIFLVGSRVWASSVRNSMRVSESLRAVILWWTVPVGDVAGGTRLGYWWAAAGPRGVEPSADPVGFEIQRTEPAPPGADGVLTDTQAGDPRVGLAPPRRQHDLGAQHQTLRRAGAWAMIASRRPRRRCPPKTMTPSLLARATRSPEHTRHD